MSILTDGLCRVTVQSLTSWLFFLAAYDKKALKEENAVVIRWETIIKWLFILSGGICLTFCGMIVTYACVQNTNLATTISLTELQKYLRTIPAQMGMLKCYIFFRNQNCCIKQTIFKTEQLINIDMFISYLLIISKEFIQSGSSWIHYNLL